MTIMFHSRPVSHSHTADYVRGASSILNIRGRTLREYDMSETPEQSDAKALQDDWAAVGRDLTDAIEIYGRNAR